MDHIFFFIDYILFQVKMQRRIQFFYGCKRIRSDNIRVLFDIFRSPTHITWLLDRRLVTLIWLTTRRFYAASQRIPKFINTRETIQYLVWSNLASKTSDAGFAIAITVSSRFGSFQYSLVGVVPNDLKAYSWFYAHIIYCYAAK